MAAPSASATLQFRFRSRHTRDCFASQLALLYMYVYIQVGLFSMSDSPGPSCGRALGDASLGGKPSYVRRLKFGRTILELDTVEQCRASSRALVVDENVARIPCTERKDYVRKWIETHGGDATRSGDTSPVLGTSVTRATTSSPILGSSGSKRRKGKTRINRHATVKKTTGDQGCIRENGERFAMRFEPDRGNEEEKEDDETERKRSSEIQRTPPGTENAVADELSPVLGTCRHRKKKRKKLQRDDVDPQREANNNCGTVRSVSETRELKESENAGVTSGVTASPIPGCQEYRAVAAAAAAKERLNLQDSSSDSRNLNIEMSASEDSRDEACDELSNSCTSSTNYSLSNLIEDVNTQESTQAVQPTRLTANDLDETYCSAAEVMLDRSTRLSARISQVTSLNRTTQKTGSKLTQTDHISSITTPSKKSPDKSMHACIFDSGKKRKKPKKGSVVSRLQSLINAQVSDIRIWRHQMSKKQDAAVQFVRVFVRSCRKLFGNQFLDGILLEDRFNLLQSNEENEETKSSNTQVRSTEASRKNITIMLVCDIVGTLKMTSNVVINLYPPWTVLDSNDLTLEVMYINISDDTEVPDVANKSSSHEREKRIVREFNCPCIEEEREMPFCSRKPSDDKPDVMERIFDF